MNPFVVPFALIEMLVYIKSMGSSQSYVSIKRDKTGPLDKSGYSVSFTAEQAHLTQ